MTDKGEMPPRFPGGATWTQTLSYARLYQEINRDRRMSEWQFETLGQRMAREPKEQSK